MADDGLKSIPFAGQIISQPGIPSTLLIITLTLALLAFARRPLRAGAATTGMGPSLPPSVMLEAALDTGRLSGFKKTRILRFLLGHFHAWFSLRHEIVPDAPVIERQILKGHSKFDLHPMGISMLRRIFGCRFPAGMDRAEFVEMHAGSMKIIARDFVNDAAATAALKRADIGARVSDLISLDPQQPKPWQCLADVEYLIPDASSGIIVEAEIGDLESLLKAFSFCIAIPLLYGRDYLQRNGTSAVLRDWGCFTSQALPLLALGMPTWVPFPSFWQGVAARDRLLDSLAAVYRRTRRYYNGEPIDADMSDISQTLLDRFKVFDRHRLSVEAISSVELSLLWAQNHNTQQLLFWFVFHVYSVPGLLTALRQEVKASGAISLAQAAPTSAGQSPRQLITALDIPTLLRDCSLLRASFLESFRLVEESVMFRHVAHPLTLDLEPDLDTHNGLTEPQRQLNIAANTWVSISNTRTNHSSRLYADPTTFDPHRFIVEKDNKKTVTYGPLRPWGIGPGMCKGRTFAEKQLLAVVACLITLWDLEPADADNSRGASPAGWLHPGFKTGATILAPAEKVRVRIRPRVGEIA